MEPGIQRPSRHWRQHAIRCLALAALVGAAGGAHPVHDDTPAHKPLWPLDGSDIATLVLATIGLIVAAGGGIGGGGILVPLFILVADFTPKQAVPLSNVTILGGAIANTLAAVMGRHPLADRPLPDWSLVLLMEPPTIIGAVVGSFANKVLPGVSISALLVIVLSLLASRTLKKGIRQFYKEGGCSSLHHAPSHEASPASVGLVQGSDGYGAMQDNSAPTANPAAGPAPSAAVPIAGAVKRRRKPSNVPSEIWSTHLPPPKHMSDITRAFSLSSVSYLEVDDGANDATAPHELEAGEDSKAAPQEGPNPQGSSNHSHTMASGVAPEDPPSIVSGMGTDVPKVSTPLLRKTTSSNFRMARILDAERSVPAWKPLALTGCFAGIAVLSVLKGGSAGSPLGVRCGSLPYWLLTLATLPWIAAFFLPIRRHILRETAAKEAAGVPRVEGDIHWTPANTIRFPLICMTAGLFAGIFGVGGGIVKGPLMLEMGVLAPVAAASAATMILYTSAAASVAYYVFGLIPLDYGALFFVWGLVCTAIGQLLINHALQRYKRESFIVLSIGSVIALSAVLMGFEAVSNFVEHPDALLHFPGLCGAGGKA